MSYIPDCRTDENYNEKFLDDQDKEFIRGFDYAVEQAQNFFNNLDVFYSEMDISGEDINLVTFLENHEEICDKFKECVTDWMEMERDQLITSMIDNMDEAIYEKIKKGTKNGK